MCQFNPTNYFRIGNRIFFSFLFIVFFTVSLYAQEVRDTIKNYKLGEVEIVSSTSSIHRSTSPVQQLGAEELIKMNALQVSDAIKYFSGVQVKDYGGIGGLKTISIRSLGAAHTMVAYDGIPITNYQTGQVDLGRFSLDNVEMISLRTGESDDIFQTARMFSSAGALNIKTKKYGTSIENPVGLRALFKAGSWDFYNPSILYEQRLSQALAIQMSGEYLSSGGNYPFVSGFGDELTRDNSDMESFRLETNLSGTLKNGGVLSMKLYAYGSDRGLPGPDIYGNHNNGIERSKDLNLFSQLHYEQKLSSKIRFQTNAKFDFSHIDYALIKNTIGSQENIYYQREYYLNATFLYKFNPDLSFSWANDGSYANFSNNFEDCVFPSRIIWQSVLSGKYVRPSVTVTGSLLSTLVDERNRSGIDRENEFNLSPYLGVSVKPLRQLPLYLRGFYKNTFRLPTFGDLYFLPVSIAPSGLKPESANQYDLGISWVNQINDIFTYFSVTSDVYLNHVDNKIVALPKGSMFIWSVQNYGEVEIKGIDTNFRLHIQTGKNFEWQLSAAYTYQNVLDKTEGKKTYNQQLAYTPHHLGSELLQLNTPWLNIGYSVIYCGKRYFEQSDRPEYEMEPYVEQSIFLYKGLKYKSVKIDVTVECLNLADLQYEVVRSYPMPGRSFRFGVRLSY